MRFLRVSAIVAFCLAILFPVTAYVLDRGFGKTVHPVVPASSEAVTLNRSLHEPGQPVAAIYGVPTSQKMRVLFVEKSRLLRPPEDPSALLLLVDKQRGENPLQVKTVWFVAWRAGAGLGLVSALALLILVLRERRARRSARVLPRGWNA